jgi:starch synthase (maltosyl-transferring)
MEVPDVDTLLDKVVAIRPGASHRTVVEGVTPAVDGGTVPARRVAGDTVLVEAVVFAEGMEEVGAELAVRQEGHQEVVRSPMVSLGNDRFRGSFDVPETGLYRFTVRGWVDPLASWRARAMKWATAGALSAADLAEGAELLDQESRRQRGAGGKARYEASQELVRLSATPEAATEFALDVTRSWLFRTRPGRGTSVTTFRPDLAVAVDPPSARSSAWYELFPRSASVVKGRSGNFRDLDPWVERIADLGFDVLYLPPIHPIGHTHRKGRNNATEAGPDDPGSPWAIGSELGGHTAIDPGLGTFEEFRALVARARERGVDIALDLAFQCSPDHPWVREHPEWFHHRPDGTIRTAENPPKQYEDLYPLDFHCREWRSLWLELYGVVEFWITQGVRRFRVDNPHTKPFPFWEWLLKKVRKNHPEVTFLAEAFTRPPQMYQLAKIGFTHSYTYFAWRSGREELISYFGELGGTELREYFRPHLWPNTPDILTEELQTGGLPTFATRFVLASTLSSNYGIYGPLFEEGEFAAIAPGKEEYRDSEKYQLRHWELRPRPLDDLIRCVNAARRESPALTALNEVVFHPVDNPHLIAYSRSLPDGSNPILVVVNLDPHHVQSGWTDLRLDHLGLGGDESYDVHDLLTERTWRWHGNRNFVELRPQGFPAHVLRVERIGIATGVGPKSD